MRPDCVQVVIALVVTPQGFPLAYEVMPGNTSDKTTSEGFSRTHRRAVLDGRTESGSWTAASPPKRHWSRCAPPNRPSIRPGGNAKGRLSKFERQFLKLPWQAVRPSVDVKLLAHDKELYIASREAIPAPSKNAQCDADG